MFNLSKCPKCENAQFKLAEVSPQGSNYKMYFVQCTRCASPVGVTDFYDTNSQIQKLEQRLSGIESTIQQIAHRVNQLR